MKNAYIYITLLLSILGIQSAFSQCDILISDSSPCASATVNFNVDNPSGSYAWDFNNDNLIDAFSTAASYSYPENYVDVPYTIVLYKDGIACNTMGITVEGEADPTIGVIPGSGILEDNMIRVCSSNPEISLELYNASASYSINQSYSINWGDGSIENFDNTSFSNTSTITHDYSTYGYFTITLTVTTVTGCISTNSYTLYNGSNPSVGLANPGNTVGLCVPATINFPLTNTASNATGTVYTVYISGEIVATYTQDNVPSIFSYTFLESSCDNTTSTGNYDNAFDVQILASNPCGTSQATIEPIEISEPLDLVFDVDQPSIGCEGTIYTFTNDSEGLGEVGSGNCTDLAPSWSITPGIPGVDWEIVGGNTFASQEIEVIFLVPGVYTIEMVINSPSCGLQAYAQAVEIFEGTEVSVSGYLETVVSPGNENCIPTVGYFFNESQGDSLVFTWDVNPNNGWEYVDTFNENSHDLQIMFTEAGEYTIFLSAENYCGIATWDTTLTIAAAPEITLDPFPIWCNEATLDFDDNNVNIELNYGILSSIEWSFPGATPSSSSELYPTNIQYAIPGSYWVDVTITNECGTATTSQNIVIESSGAVNVGDDIIICEDAAAFFVTATPAGGTWSGNGVTVEGEFTPSNINIGQNTLTYSVDQGSCVLEEDLVVTVTPLPVIEMPNEQVLCINESTYDLSAVTPTGGTWTGTGISGNSFDPTIAGIGIHTITYSYNDLNSNCSASETMNMEVIPLPLITVSDSSYCILPGLVALPYASPAGGSWSGPGVVGDNFDPEAVGGPGNYTLSYSYVDDNYCENTAEAIIVLVEPVNVDLGNDVEVCENANSFFVSGTPTGGTWIGNGVTAEGEFTPNNDNIGQNVLTYIVDQGSCILEENLVVTVTPLPVIEMPNEQVLCVNEPAYGLSGVTPSGGTWTGTGISGNSFDPAIAGIGIHTINYSYVDPITNCSASATMNMEVLPLPIITVSDSNYCITPGLVALPYASPAGGNWSGPAVVGNSFNPQAAGGPGNYTLSYSYIDSSYCENTAEVIITLVEPINVNAGSDFEICENADIIDLSQVASPIGGSWNANGSLGLNGSIFDPALAGVGTHILSYSIGTGNCTVMDEIEIIVLPIPVVETMDDVEICINTDIIMLEANPLGGQWISNNGGSLVGNTFNPLTNGNGVYSFTYFYTDPNGCLNTDDVLITVFPVGEAAFSMPDFACRNEPVEFTNLSTPGNQMYWQFGVGTGNSTDINPTYTFTAVGDYTVTLIIENEFGCTDTVEHDIRIGDVPVALFEPLVTETCANTGVEFNNQSFGDSLSFYWEFGNFQTSTEEDPGIVYFEQANFDTTYVITLTVSNPCGSSVYQSLIVVHPIPNINFGLVPLTDCSPVMVDFANSSSGSATAYFWDFGNGNTSTEQFPETEAFFTDSLFSIYTITLIGSNSCGSDTAIVDLLVESANVVAAAEVSINNGCAPLSVEFTNYSSPTATIDWDFGDGNSSSLAEPSHTYTEPGNYLVIQYASSDCGYDTTVFNINVYPAPEVSFEHDENVCGGQTIEFTNLAINTSGHFWDFGDGDTSLLTNPIHTYDTAGVYLVTLTGISIFNQCPATYTSEITVLDLPTSDFEPSTTFGCAPLEVSFSNNSNNALFYEWDFGDGNTTIDDNPTHTFLEAGTYEVTLRATDINGCFDDYTIYNVIVQPQPISDFSYTRNSDCGLPVSFNFQNISEGGIDYEWSFGDGSTSTFTDPEHIYTEVGIYEVSLISFNQFSCSDTFNLSFEIYELTEASLEISSMSGCEPVEVTFSNNSSNTNQYLWDFGDNTTSEESEPTHLYDRAGSYPVQLIASLDGICPDTFHLSELVEVYPTPVANFEAIEVGGDGTYEMTNLSLHSDNYFWEFSDAATSIEENPTHRFNTNGVHQIYLESSNEYGCVDDTIVNFTPEFINGLFIPNAFSPEQGIGDVRVFKAKGIGLKEYRLQIYSTYGQLLWETTELDEEGRPTEGWDGIVDGKMMPQDVYVWKCSGIFNDGSGWRGVVEDNGNYKVIGSLVLLR